MLSGVQHTKFSRISLELQNKVNCSIVLKEGGCPWSFWTPSMQHTCVCRQFNCPWCPVEILWLWVIRNKNKCGHFLTVCMLFVLNIFIKRQWTIESSNVRSAVLKGHVSRSYSIIQKHFALTSWRTDSSEAILAILSMTKLAARWKERLLTKNPNVYNGIYKMLHGSVVLSRFAQWASQWGLICRQHNFLKLVTHIKMFIYFISNAEIGNIWLAYGTIAHRVRCNPLKSLRYKANN